MSEWGITAGYADEIQAKYTAKQGVQIAGMIFQTCSRPVLLLYISTCRMSI
ncbi:DUF6783 domain-containing protein [Blautia faecis]|uniref:DUF6783 domain-containing protein n=1 Tax=Ruminococcus sp. RTP21484sp1 TaxID=3151395 RepID=UPI002FE6CA7F